ncbi:MAG: hypothetical protein H6739_03140 [Alphaproteobacteria bacterium]|nr:hypothetical protein [Alphaproteobacteria bacterium]
MILAVSALLACSGASAPEAPAPAPQASPAPTAEAPAAAGSPHPFIDALGAFDPKNITERHDGCSGVSESQIIIYDDGEKVWFGILDDEWYEEAPKVFEGVLVNTRGNTRYFSVHKYDVVLTVNGGEAWVAEADEDAVKLPISWDCGANNGLR